MGTSSTNVDRFEYRDQHEKYLPKIKEENLKRETEIVDEGRTGRYIPRNFSVGRIDVGNEDKDRSVSKKVDVPLPKDPCFDSSIPVESERTSTLSKRPSGGINRISNKDDDNVSEDSLQRG